MASIPHGTAILAQGTTQFLDGGPPHIPDNNIIPFPIGTAPPANSDFASGEAEFPEFNLSIPTAFRLASPGVTQDMVRNPNSLIQAALHGQAIENTDVHQDLHHARPMKGGGHREHRLPRGRLKSSRRQRQRRGGRRDLLDRNGREEPAASRTQLQLQYTQLVQLDFNGLRWPHVTVATLHKQ